MDTYEATTLPIAPDDTLLRLATAAHLARYKGRSREHVLSDLRAYFVSIDPVRDTPEVLGDYVSWVSDRITGITGDADQIDRLADAWGVFYEKVPLEGDDYTMDHTASVFLLDRQGQFQGTIAYREDMATALGKLRNLLAKS